MVELHVLSTEAGPLDMKPWPNPDQTPNFSK